MKLYIALLTLRESRPVTDALTRVAILVSRLHHDGLACLSLQTHHKLGPVAVPGTAELTIKDFTACQFNQQYRPHPQSRPRT